MGRKPEVLPSVSSWEARDIWIERIGQAKLSLWTKRKKMDGGKHRKEERAEGKTVNTKANNEAPSKQGGIASAKRKRLPGAQQRNQRRD